MAKKLPDLDVCEFFTKHTMPIPRLGDWRYVTPEQGEVNGLPESRGKVVVSDGIICFIERLDGTVYRGHYTAWVADKEVASPSAKRKSFKMPVCFQDC